MAVIIFAVVGVFVNKNNTNTDQVNNNVINQEVNSVNESVDSLGATTSEPTYGLASSSPESTGVAVKYKDGQYTSAGVYNSPAGSEEVEVSVTIENNKIAQANFTGKATNKASVNNQNRFASGFESYVIGKDVDSVNLTVVNGSSLTPIGFMDALEKIKGQASK